tara:strand:- start:5169 stop:5936 length:768 start_codon:yes stop_codon:yes gene_type:complete
MQKRGQITIFLIVGIILIIVAGILFTVLKDFKKSQIEINDLSTTPIQNYVNSCLTKTGQEAGIFIGKHGGYYQLPQNHNSEFNLPYYLIDGMKSLPTIELVQNQLAKYVEDQLAYCLQNFHSFEGREILSGRSTVSTIILDNKILFSLNLPITIKFNNVEESMTTFSVDILSKLGMIIDAISKYMHLEEDSICISCWNEIMENFDLQVEIIPIDDDIMQFIVSDGDYQFNFLSKYQFELIEKKEFIPIGEDIDEK